MRITSSVLISDKNLNTLKANPNIKSITLGSKTDTYPLTSDIYQDFKETQIESIQTFAVATELENNFDSLIGFNQNKSLICGYNHDSLQILDELYIKSPLSQEEQNNFKYLNPQANLFIYFDSCKQFYEIIKSLNNLNQKRNITIHVTNKNLFNDELFSVPNLLSEIQKQNIQVQLASEVEAIDIKSYIKYERQLTEMIKPALALSPFERYLYAYNIAKQFKDYKESPNKANESRKLYTILENEYIVCVGFSKLLGDLLDKLNIENAYYAIGVETGLDHVDSDALVLPNEVISKKTGSTHPVEPNREGHARREIHLVDPKYGIDGYYIADATWDNDLQNDSYIHALMTQDEMVNTKRYSYIDYLDENELLAIHSIEEFYKKLNILLDKNPNYKLKDYILRLLKRFREIDKDFYQALCQKYQIEIGKPFNQPFKIQQDILYDMGIHIIKKENNLVDGEAFKQGITTIYYMIYDPTAIDIESLVEQTMAFNKESYADSFPIRYRIDKDGNKTIVANEINKFNLDESPTEKISL